MNIENTIYEHCLGNNSPLGTLLNEGHFPDSWIEEFIKLVDQAHKEFEDKKDLPVKLVGALHAMTLSPHNRYRTYKLDHNKVNEKTEKELNEIRSRCNLFFYSKMKNEKDLTNGSN